MKLILASKSPRRQAILEMLGFDFETIAADVDETQIQKRILDEFGLSCHAKLVEELARVKAKEVWDFISNNEEKIVLAADTIVVLNNQILGKPHNELEAISMLESLSGQTHEVFTGVAIYTKNSIDAFHQKAEVTFCELDDFQKNYIKKYVASGDPLDKAGAYGIQDTGSVIIKEVNGDFYTIMGLPVQKTYRKLANLIF